MSFQKALIRNLSANELNGKRVLLRVDFNVPLDDKKQVTDDSRIREALPTLKYLISAGAKTIVITHFGRPKGKVVEDMRVTPILPVLENLLKTKVLCSKESVGSVSKQMVDSMKNGDVLLLENIRFHAEEEKNDPEFSKQLAALGDLFVNDAFGTAHRAHASTVGVTKYLPAYAGFLIEKELEMLGKNLDHPERPFMAIIGGSKVSSKMGVLKHLVEKVNTIVIGGGMTFTFLKGLGKEIGKSICEPDLIPEAMDFLNLAAKKNVRVILPVDVGIGDSFSATAIRKDVSIDSIPSDWEGMDAGPETVKMIVEAIASSKTVLWNGPLGVFEFDRFATGTMEVAKALANNTLISIIGGGDSAAAIKKAGLSDRMTHISTGGGASLEFLEGKVLPGIAALKDA